MWNIIQDGASILNVYKEGVFISLVCAFGLGVFTIKQMVSNKLTGLGLLSSFGVGTIVLSVVSYILIFFAYFWPPILQLGSVAVFIFAVFYLLKQLWLNKIKAGINYRFIAISLGLTLLLIVRLAYLKYIIVPPYSDSPIHYQIVLGFIDSGENSRLSPENVLGNYYHFGFHSLTAWLVLISKLDPLVAIPLLGQLFLVMSPVSVAALTYGITKNSMGAMASGVLAAFGWLMPAFAVNWGKFPALMAITIMPVVLLWFLILRNEPRKPILIFYGLVLLIGITLIHTRIALCLLLAFTGFFISDKLKFKDEFSFFQSIRFSLLFALSLWPFSQLLVDFYNDMPIWIILLLLIPFAFQSYPMMSTGTLFFLFGLGLITFIPKLLMGNSRVLLDRQFLEMMMYIPFSVMGGLGFGGLVRKLESNSVLKWGLAVLLVGCVIFNFQRSNSFYPDSCCNYFKENDRLAFQWIQNHSSDHTLFIISTFTDNGKIYGTDAGMWIYPLTKRPVNKLPFNFKWDSSNAIGELCPPGVRAVYIYMGGGEYSFDDLHLNHVAWLKPAFQVGEVVIYETSICNQ